MRAAVSRLRPPVEWILLVPIAVVFLAGVRRELPYVYHADEFRTFDVSVGLLDRHSLDPQFFRYPTLMFYLHALVLAPFELVGRVEPIERIALGSGYAPNPNLVMLLRIVTAIFALGAVALAMSIARRVSGKSIAAIVAAIVLGTSPMMIEHSRYIATDTYAAALATAAVLASIGVYRNGRMRDYLLAGALAGFAGGAKYNAILVVVAVGVAHLLRHPEADELGRDDDSDEPTDPDVRAGAVRSAAGPIGWIARSRRFGALRTDRLRALVASGAIALGAFVLSTPYLLFDFDRFWDDVSFEMQHYSTGHPGASGSSPWHYVEVLWRDLGLLLAVSILAFAARKTRREAMIVASFVVGYLVFVSRYPLRFDRTILPVLPCLAALIGIGIASVWDLGATRRWGRRTQIGLRAAVIAALVAVIVEVPFPEARDQVRLVDRDERRSAREWIAENVPAGSRVLVSQYPPWVNPNVHQVAAFSFGDRTCAKVPGSRTCVPKAPDTYRGSWDFIVLAEGEFGRYYRNPKRYAEEVAAFDALRAAFPVAAEFSDYGYKIVVLQVA